MADVALGGTAERNLVWLQSIVAAQTKNIALWGCAITPPEERLQDALLRLHEAIQSVQPEEHDA